MRVYNLCIIFSSKVLVKFKTLVFGSCLRFLCLNDIFIQSYLIGH